MTLTNNEKTLLQGILDHREILKRNFDRSGSYARRATISLHRSDANDGYVPMDLARWIGHGLEKAERKLVARILDKLERLGLVEKCCLYGAAGMRCTHVLLKPEGERIALELANAARTQEKYRQHRDETKLRTPKGRDIAKRS